MPDDVTDDRDEASTPQPVEAPSPISGRRVDRRFPLQFLADVELDESPEWLVEGLAPARGLLVLYGAPGGGKSFVALDLALHVAAGRTWAGREVQPAGVVYVASEAGRGMRKRVLGAIRHHGFPSTLPLAFVETAPDLGSRDGDAKTLVDDIVAQLPEGFAVGLVILDTLARSMPGGDESGTAGMSAFIRGAEAIGRALGALVMPIHHVGKDANRGMRGSSSLLGAADAVWYVAPVTVDKAPHIVIEKLKEEADGGEVPFALQRVVIETDRKGHEISTCVVSVGEVLSDAEAAAIRPTLPAAAEPDRHHEALLTAGMRTFLDNLAVVIDRHGEVITRLRKIPKATRVVRQANLGTFAEIVMTSSSAKSRQNQADRFVRELVERGFVARHDGYVWLAMPESLTQNQEIREATAISNGRKHSTTV